MEDYLPILNALAAAGVEHAMIGTAALKLHFPTKMADYALKDCDLVLAPDEKNVLLAIAVLRAEQWEVFSWEKPVFPNATMQELTGRFYLRATKGALMLDLTYECRIPWEEMVVGRLSHGGLQLASVNDILELKRQQGVEKGDLSAYQAMLDRLFGPQVS